MRVVLDSSALLSVLFLEPDKHIYALALERTELPLISAVTLLEVQTVLHRRIAAATNDLDRLLISIKAETVAFDRTDALIASAAYRRYGKGTGHKAQLNYGDCAAYALARTTGLPLLFKGRDFAATDIIPALPLLVPEAGETS